MKAKTVWVIWSIAIWQIAVAGILDDLYEPKDYTIRRVSSYDTTGGNLDRLVIPCGQTIPFAEIRGAGIVKHIWITMACADAMIRRNAVLRIYWDGEENPSVESPIGDFFGQGWGESYRMNSLPVVAAPKKGNAMNCYFPMPFSRSARFTLENQSESDISAFYFYIDYEQHRRIPDDLPRFHAWWNRSLTEPHAEGEDEWNVLGKGLKHPPRLGNNYVFAEIEGRGHFVGLNYYVDCPTPMWYGEGDDMFFIDGEPWPPRLHGTGTEDFFNSSWSPKEVFMHPFFGYARVNEGSGWMGRTHCYRFLLEAPLPFRESLVGSIEHGHANNLTLDLVTVAYWYQTEPHKPFPALPAVEKRQNMPEIRVTDMHRWRDAWRRDMGSGTLWGTEKKP